MVTAIPNLDKHTHTHTFQIPPPTHTKKKEQLFNSAVSLKEVTLYIYSVGKGEFNKTEEIG